MSSQGVTFDTGMLIALERRKQRAWKGVRVYPIETVSPLDSADLEEFGHRAGLA